MKPLVVLDDPCESLTNQDILWFCGSMFDRKQILFINCYILNVIQENYVGIREAKAQYNDQKTFNHKEYF